MKIAIVTGASSGIGREFVLSISERYKNIEEIWVIARTEEKLTELQSIIKNKKIRPITADLKNTSDISKIEELLKEKEPDIRVLVNAAGYGRIGKFEDLSCEDNLGMCSLNISALTHMTKICIPYMRENSSIINIASAAAFAPQPSFAVYSATKSYVYFLSLALRKELSYKKIKVTAVCPGPVDTAFFDKAEKYTTAKLYKKMFKANPKKVVDKALTDAYHNKPKSVYGVSMKLFSLVGKLVPYNTITKFIS